jgi:hypothetical protein
VTPRAGRWSGCFFMAPCRRPGRCPTPTGPASPAPPRRGAGAGLPGSAEDGIAPELCRAGAGPTGRPSASPPSPRAAAPPPRPSAMPPGVPVLRLGAPAAAGWFVELRQGVGVLARGIRCGSSGRDRARRHRRRLKRSRPVLPRYGAAQPSVREATEEAEPLRSAPNARQTAAVLFGTTSTATRGALVRQPGPRLRSRALTYAPCRASHVLERAATIAANRQNRGLG